MNEKSPTLKDWLIFGVLLALHAAILAGLLLWAGKKLDR